MTRDPLSLIVSQFKSETSRTGSLIITFYGDAILPRGGSVWLGTLLAFLELLAIDGGVVRTAMSRLAADGWLEREKIGRKSYYKLAADGRARFESGIRHVYHPHASDWEGRLELLLIGNGGDREAARAALGEAGFGSPMPGVWVAPAGAPVPAAAGDVIRLDVSASHEMGRRLIGEAWPLAEIGGAYRDFIETFTPLQAWLSKSGQLSPADAMLARVLLIHHYRRVLLRDPLLPAALLPADWPAAEARLLCGRIYQALLPPSEQWLDAFGESVTGKLPAPDTGLAERFAGI
ncbi:phenylacetic acid degradation operon negative regulatory protein PaaX [Tardiphaga alba]|uniref:Phenylacetic acid degradation operon negative regulatory protein PaaX n=1 Tax=Tardiphaga alba TaxID=340268 RepID=A0ABX8ABR0_9BRAD|nr:phenylacetic acid degradation operon negative regulatory protein PaaX [Tardiphaga alba]QUS41142.1 phenylacetic acid degradation operon negative regulatory protein PaaX [Tardiphaga alba]